MAQIQISSLISDRNQINNITCMKNILFSALLIVPLFISHAQVNPSNSGVETGNTASSNGAEIGFGISTMTVTSNYSRVQSYGGSALSENTIGSPFLHDNFLTGAILKGDEIIKDNIGVRYNVIDDIFEGKLDILAADEKAKLIIKSPDYQIKIQNQLFMVAELEGVPKYFEVIQVGSKESLLKMHVKKFNPEIQATTSLTRSVPATFKYRTEFYMLNEAGETIELPSSKKKMIKLFGERGDEIKALIKEKKLNLSKEKDLVQLFKSI